jgi:hypothetical protein
MLNNIWFKIKIIVIIFIFAFPIVILGYLFYKNYYFPNGFSAVYDLKQESKYITPLKPLSAVGEIVDTWTPGKAETQLGTLNIETREIFQPIIDDFFYTDIFLPKKFEKLNLALLYRADTPEMKVCLKTGAGDDNLPSQDSGEAGWSCQIFYVDRQSDNWYTLTATWDLADAYQIKPRHYRIGFFLPGLNEKNGILHIKKIQIEAK